MKIICLGIFFWQFYCLVFSVLPGSLVSCLTLIWEILTCYYFKYFFFLFHFLLVFPLDTHYFVFSPIGLECALLIFFNLYSLCFLALKCQSLGWEDPLEEEMATHSSVLVWKISQTEELGGLQSMGLQRVNMTEHMCTEK